MMTSSVRQVVQMARVLDVVDPYVSLKKRPNGDYWGISPFAPGERTASFHVVDNGTSNYFKCFSTGKGGGAIKFLMELDNIPFIESVRRVGRMYGVELEEAEQEYDFKTEYEALAYFANRWHENLFNNLEALEYVMDKRKLDEKTIETFQIGLCDNRASDSAYDQSLLHSIDILHEHEGRFYDSFYNRITFPIRNPSGKVIGFSGRIWLPSSVNGKRPKYKNTKETQLFHKSSILYGLYEHREAIKKKGALLMEGYMGVVGTHSAGLGTGVATMGTAISEYQTHLLHRYTSNVSLIRDGDMAGELATKKDIEAFLSRGIDPVIYRIANTGQKLDPDDLRLMPGFSPDPASFPHTQMVHGYIQMYRQDYESIAPNQPDTMAKKVNLVRDCIRAISMIPDPIVRNENIKIASEAFSLPVETLSSEVVQSISKAIKSSQKQTMAPPSASNKVAAPDKFYWIAHILVKHPDLILNGLTVAQHIKQWEANECGYYQKELSRIFWKDVGNFNTFDGSLYADIVNFILTMGDGAIEMLSNSDLSNSIAAIMEAETKPFNLDVIKTWYWHILADKLSEALKLATETKDHGLDPGRMIEGIVVVKSYIKYLQRKY